MSLGIAAEFSQQTSPLVWLLRGGQYACCACPLLLRWPGVLVVARMGEVAGRTGGGTVVAEPDGIFEGVGDGHVACARGWRLLVSSSSRAPAVPGASEVAAGSNGCSAKLLVRTCRGGNTTSKLCNLCFTRQYTILCGFCYCSLQLATLAPVLA